jgi:hypothetical protein
MVYTDSDGNHYNRMLRIPEEPLKSVHEGSLPVDAVERYLVMCKQLERKEIVHGNLNSANIMWDKESKIFFPVEFSDIKEPLDPESNLAKNIEKEHRKVIGKIKRKINPSFIVTR